MKFNIYKIFSSFLTLIIIAPIIALFVFSVGGSSETLAHLYDTVLMDYIFNTLKLVFLVSILSLIFGITSAYLTVFYNFRFIHIFNFLLALPFVIPTYIMGYIYSDILGFFGPVHRLLMDLGITKNFFDVLNFNSIVVILALCLYPYIYLIVKSSFLKSSTALLNPALSLGKNRFELFYKVILPLSRPAIIGSLSLVIMETINEFGAVAYYGVDTLSTAIYASWFDLNDPKSSAFLSVITMAIIFVLLISEKYSRGKSSYKTESINSEIRKNELTGFKKYLAYLFLSIPVTLGFLIPFAWIVFYSFKYALEVIDDEFFEVVINSFVASTISALLIVTIALFITYSTRIFNTGYMKYITKAAGIGYAIPSVIVGVGVLSFFGTADNLLIENFGFSGLILSGSMVALIFGYTVKFLAIGINMCESNFDRVSININKASRNLGMSYWQTLLRVELPLMRKTLVFGFLLVFVDIIKELPLTLILRPFNYETLSSKTYEYAGNTMIQESSIYALCIVLICFIPVVISNKGKN